jgi:hypothetical protein
MNVLVLQTDIFPDAETVRAAVRALQQTDRVLTLDLRERDLGEAFWDGVIDAIADADVVVTL